MSGEPNRNRDPPGFSCLRPRGFKPAGSLDEEPTRTAKMGMGQRTATPPLTAQPAHGLEPPGASIVRESTAPPLAPLRRSSGDGRTADPGSPRNGAKLPRLGPGGGTPDVDEQPRPGGRGASRGPGRLR